LSRKNSLPCDALCVSIRRFLVYKSRTSRRSVLAPCRLTRRCSTSGPRSVVLYDPLFLYAKLPTEVLHSAAFSLVLVMHVGRLCAAPLPRCGTSSSSPKSGRVPLFPFAHGTLALPAKFPLSYSPTLVFKLSFSPTLVSKLSSSPTALRRAVTTRIRRVSGKRPAICCYCCWNLWGVVQLLTDSY